MENRLWYLLNQRSHFTEEELDPEKSSFSVKPRKRHHQEKMPLLPPNSFMFHPAARGGGKGGLVGGIFTENYLKEKKGSESSRFTVSPQQNNPNHEPCWCLRTHHFLLISPQSLYLRFLLGTWGPAHILGYLSSFTTPPLCLRPTRPSFQCFRVSKLLEACAFTRPEKQTHSRSTL